MTKLRTKLAPLLLVACACTQPAPATRRVARAPLPTPTRSPVPVVNVAYRIDVRVPGGREFGPLVAATMSDPRGWSRAGFRVREDPSAAYVVVLAEGAEVDALCLPYDTGGEYSCQNGPVVAINAERWREGVPHWRNLATYRQMLVNHEMGHLLGQKHRPCPGRGLKAPVMYQQSGSLKGCRPNAWPLAEEIERASRHDLKLAPAFGE